MKRYRGTVMVDLDGVLFDFAGKFRDWLSNLHFREYMAPRQWHFYADWGLAQDEFVDLLNLFARQHQFMQEPIPGAIEFVQALAAMDLRIIVCTHRTKDAVDDTLRWIEWYFPIVNDVLIITDGSTKSAFMNGNDGPFFAIDDKPETITELADLGVWAMLHHAPWNEEHQTELHPRVKRTLSYRSALEYIESRLLVAERENGVAEARRLNAGRETQRKVITDCGITSEPVQEAAFQQAPDGTEAGPFVVKDGKWVWNQGDEPTTIDMRWPYDDESEEVTYTDPTTGGKKGVKPDRYDLLPVEPLRIVARHYGIGAGKYGDRNWERGYPWSLSYAALQRHLNAFWAGENLDPETQSPHLAAVVFHALALLEFMQTHPEMDDRSIRSN